MPGEQVLRKVMPIADDALAAGIGRDRRLQPFGQGQHLRPGLGGAAADIDQRLLRACEERRRLGDQLLIRRRHRQGRLRVGQRDFGFQRHDVERHFERDRAGPAVGKLAEGFVDALARLARVVDARRPFGQALQDRELVRHLVQQPEAAADQV